MKSKNKTSLPIWSKSGSNCYGDTKDPGSKEYKRWFDLFLNVCVENGGRDSDDAVHSDCHVTQERHQHTDHEDDPVCLLVLNNWCS